MPASPKYFKVPPKRFHPKGTDILYEDHDILVVNKINGLLTMGSNREREKTAYFYLTNYVRRGNPRSKDRIFIVHRLDKDTSGTLVFAKTEQAKRYLQDNWSDFSKTYVAVVHGTMPQSEGMIESWLTENKIHRVYSTDDKSIGKLARTAYKVIREDKGYSLLNIELHTGRKNQIRVHLAEQNCPVVGDRKYGPKVKGTAHLALHAAKLCIKHPHTKTPMTFEASLPRHFAKLIQI